MMKYYFFWGIWQQDYPKIVSHDEYVFFTNWKLGIRSSEYKSSTEDRRNVLCRVDFFIACNAVLI